MGLHNLSLSSISCAMLLRSNTVETVVHGLPDTCPGYTVVRMRIVMASPRGWCNVTLLYKPFHLHYQAVYGMNMPEGKLFLKEYI